MDRNFNPNRKLTYEEKEKAIELKEQIILEQCGLCSKCHKPLTFPVEIAHRIPKANMYVKLYGWNIINHRYNLRATHKDCNSGVLLNPTTHPEEVYELITQIEKDLEGIMELLTTSAPIIEQDNHGCKTVGIPKAYIKRRGLIRKDVLYATIEKDGKGISITYSEYLRKDSIKRSILESGGYYRIVLPKSDLHKKGNRWDVYTNNNGLLRYELLN